MRFGYGLFGAFFLLGSFVVAEAKNAPAASPSAPAPPVEVTADTSLEWYQDQNMYVARGNAKAVRGDLTVIGDVLTAHERDKPKTPDGKKPPKQQSSPNSPDNKDVSPSANGTAGGSNNGQSGDIDRMTAEGHVLVLKPNTRITGEHAVDDVDQHVIVLTGDNLRYETDKQVVTAKDTLEYWEERKIAVARGHAIAVKGDRHVEGDVLTAEFRDQPNGSNQLDKMMAVGHVTVITKSDITRGDQAIYDAARDIAIVTGHVTITRADGTELTGDVGESDFANNQSRLLNDGSGRVRALLPPKTTDKSGQSNTSGHATPGKVSGENGSAN